MAASEENSAEGRRKEEIIDVIVSAKALGSKKLDLSKKQIIDIPSELQALQRLEFLYLEGNLVQFLPTDFFFGLQQLKWLDLRNNKLKCLPESIGESRCLRSLLLEGNKLERLPLELGLVKSLSGLHLANNPLEFPPQKIVEQGAQVIIGFLRDCLMRRKEEIQDLHKADEVATENETLYQSRGEERALEDPPLLASPSPPLKLPPIRMLEPSTNINVDTDSLASTSSDSIIGSKGAKKGHKKFPEKLPKEHRRGDKKKHSRDTSNESADKGAGQSKDSTKASKSPIKTSPKHKKKAKVKVAKGRHSEGKTIMNATAKDGGQLDIDYKVTVNERSEIVDNFQRIDTTVMNQRIGEIMDEEKAKTRQIRELIESQTILEDESHRKRGMKVSIDGLKVDDMVVIEVPEKHFIPGQPCIGKVVSMPDANGLLLVHYYTGFYDGEWRPMMSRSSPYLRKVPASRIVHKFRMNDNARMSAATILAVRKALDDAENA